MKPTTIFLTLFDLIDIPQPRMPRVGRDYCIYYPILVNGRWIII